ncbi:MAG: hypothetical protein RLZZ198_1268 [Bacteroidota bacterium]|jgi:uncharacterized repeat protein (TIGR01451 family)
MKKILPILVVALCAFQLNAQTGYALTGLNLLPNTVTTRCDTAVTVAYYAQSAANNAQSTHTLPFVLSGNNFVSSQFQFNISWGDGTSNTYNGGVSSTGTVINLNPPPAHTYPGPGTYTLVTNVTNWANQTSAVDTVVLNLGSCSLPVYSLIQVDCNNDGVIDSTLNNSGIPLVITGSGQSYTGITQNNYYLFTGIEPGLYTLGIDPAWLAANNYTIDNIQGPPSLVAGSGAQTMIITLNCGNGGNQNATMCVGGQVYCDQDNNGQFSNGDIPIVNAPITINYGAGSTIVYTNQQGNYSTNYLGLLGGIATVSLNSNWLTQHGYSAANLVDTISNIICMAGAVPATVNFPVQCGQNPGNPTCYSGFVFCDANNNGIMDNNELPMTFAPVVLSNTQGANANTVTVYTDSLGYFTYCGQFGNGQYVLASIPSNYLNYLGYSVNFNFVTLIVNQAAGMLPVNCGGNGGNTCADLWTTVTPWIGYYQNTTAHIRLNWGNYGPSSTGSYNLTLTFPAGVTVNTASINTPGYSIAGNTITWNLNSSLSSFSANDIIQFSIPGGLINGANHYFTSTITPTGNIQDCNMQNNNGSLLQILGNSYDPNDKNVARPEFYNNGLFGGTEIETGVDDILTYTIRFQNTGTAPAQNIVVVDTLDADLDLSTFTLVSSSHAVELVNMGNGIMHFEFNGIWLPDSTSNEPLSHGQFTYRIRENAGNVNMSEITNTAYIYFDWNAPIITNTTYNVNTWIEGIDEASDLFKVFPNPTTDALTIEARDAFNYTVYDLNGRAMIQGKGNSMETISLQTLMNGQYILSLNTGNSTRNLKVTKL